MTLAVLRGMSGKVASALDVSRIVTSTERVAGFDVRRPPQEDGRWSEERAAYRVAARGMEGMLRDVGVEPVAVMPAAWWDRVTERAGLLELMPDRDGMAGFDVRAEANAADRVFHGIAMVAITLFAFGMAYLLSDSPLVGSVATPFLSAMVLMAFGVACMMLVPPLIDSLLAKGPVDFVAAWAYVILRGGPSASWRRMVRYGRRSEGNACPSKVAVAFPSPSASLAETLLKVREHQFMLAVAARPGGARLGSSAASVIADAMRGKIHHTSPAGEARGRLDGVLLCRLNDVVAVLHEEGDCGITKAIVEDALRDPPHPLMHPLDVGAEDARPALKVV